MCMLISTVPSIGALDRAFKNASDVFHCWSGLLIFVSFVPVLSKAQSMHAMNCDMLRGAVAGFMQALS